MEQQQKLTAAKSVQPFLDDIEFVNVPDITKDDAFTEAIKDVNLVLHIASPIFDSTSASAAATGHVSERPTVFRPYGN
jgi:saccharopine dehydrogenase-like NADP-dependent oxidoreductase